MSLNNLWRKNMTKYKCGHERYCYECADKIQEESGGLLT